VRSKVHHTLDSSVIFGLSGHYNTERAKVLGGAAHSTCMTLSRGTQHPFVMCKAGCDTTFGHSSRQAGSIVLQALLHVLLPEHTVGA
jgi:hypothetical protein